MIPRLLLITDRHVTPDLLPVIVQAVLGGVDHVLLREKDLNDQQLAPLATRILQILAGTPARLLISGRPHLALAIGAAGVHLPQNSLSIAQTRAILGSDKMIGRSCHDALSAKQACAQGADYITLSPLFSTPSHPQTPPLGLKKFTEICRNLDRPVLALGGINADNIHLAMTAGASGVALIRGILDQENPRAHAEKISSLMENFID
ncbi:MAG: thiamine-phosphate synthase [Magnetococcales bacterium]|nr:thiamine-phosphate synthase [Magnetococcales bacterium]